MKTLSIYVAGLFFACFAAVHLIRFIQGWAVSIGGTEIPMGASYVALLVSVALAYGLLKGEKKPE